MREARPHLEALVNRFLKMPIEMLLPPGYSNIESMKRVRAAKVTGKTQSHRGPGQDRRRHRRQPEHGAREARRVSGSRRLQHVADQDAVRHAARRHDARQHDGDRARRSCRTSATACRKAQAAGGGGIASARRALDARREIGTVCSRAFAPPAQFARTHVRRHDVHAALLPSAAATRSAPLRAGLSDPAGTLVVRYPAGGSTDLIARIIGQWLSERLGQPVVVENKPGGGTNIADAGRRQRAAGRLHAAVHGRDQRDQSSRSTSRCRSTSCATSRRSRASPSCRWCWRSIRRCRPRPSPSSSPTPRPIPARSTSPRSAPARSAISRSSCSRVDGRHRHRARALSRRRADDHRPASAARCRPASTRCRIRSRTSSAARCARSPCCRRDADRRRCPTCRPSAETIPGFEVSTWSGIGAPTGTPPEIVERLNREINAGLQDAALLKRFADVGGTPIRASAGRSAADDRRGHREVGQGGERQQDRSAGELGQRASHPLERTP